MIQKNRLVEKIDSIDYTHLLGYPSEVVAAEVIAMVKEVASDYMDKAVEQLKAEYKPIEKGRRNGKTLRIGFNGGIARAIEIVKGGAV